MAQITLPYRPVNGNPEDISQIIADLDAILAQINGNLDNSNVAAAAAIALSKLAGYPNDATKFARGDSTWAVPAGASYKACRAVQIVSQNISHNVVTAVTFGGEVFDTDSYHDVASNTSRFTAPRAGKYRLSGRIWFGAHATGLRSLIVRKNADAALRIDELRQAAWGVDWNTVSFSGVADLAVNDYVEVYAYQDSGVVNVLAAGTTLSPGSGTNAIFEELG